LYNLKQFNKSIIVYILSLFSSKKKIKILKIKMNNFKIIASLHQLKDTTKIVTSILKYNNKIDFNIFSKNIDNLSLHTNYTRKYLILNIDDYGTYEPIVENIRNNTILLHINTFKFFDIIYLSHNNLKVFKAYNEKNKKIKFNRRTIDINNIFRDILLTHYKNNNIDFKNNLMEYNIIFIFNNIIWSNIVYGFKAFDFELFGGSGNRRHLLSITQSNLTEFLLILNNMHLSNNIVINSFNEKSTIEARIDMYLSKNIKVYNTNSKNFTYFDILNIKFRHFSRILEQLEALNELYQKIELIEYEMKEAKEQISHYTVPNPKLWDIKKITNANVRFSKASENKATLAKDIPKLEEKLQTQIHALYLVDNNLFNEKNECIFNTNIVKDPLFVPKINNENIINDEISFKNEINKNIENNELIQNNIINNNINKNNPF